MTPEAWLRGPVDGVPEPLQPVVHALVQALDEQEGVVPALDEQEGVVPALSREELHARPGGSASIAFHLTHLAGSTDRLFTYARGEALSQEQREWLKREKDPPTEPTGSGRVGDQESG